MPVENEMLFRVYHENEDWWEISWDNDDLGLIQIKSYSDIADNIPEKIMMIPPDVARVIAINIEYLLKHKEK